jgi:SAM-dependent methyltransferase
MTKEDWWKPENLKSSEKTFLENDNITDLDTGNDFGSYKVMRMTDDVGSSQINAHNDLTPRYRVSSMRSLLGGKVYSKILDIGCGLGYTTSEIADVFDGADVTGIDISEDAILYAKKHFQNCEFRCEAINPNEIEQHFGFDLITAFEFYPFTRTSSLKDHISYIAHLTKDMRLGGSLVIFQLWDNPNSLSVNYEALRTHFSHLDFKAYAMPIRVIGTFVHYRRLAVFMSTFLRPILRVITKRKIGRNKIIVITKNAIS